MNKLSRTEYSIRNILVNFAGFGLNLLLSFICRVIFVHYLKTEYLGINGLFSNILSMLSLTELGIGTAIVYALYRPIEENNTGKLASLVHLFGNAYRIIGCIVAVIGLALLPFLKIIIKEPPNINDNLKIIYILFLFSSASSYFFSYRATILTANQRNYIVNGINYCFVIVQNILQILILVLSRNYLLYLIVQIICTFASNFFISLKATHDYPYITEKHPTPLSRSEKWTLVKNVKALVIIKLSGLLVNNTDNIVITYFNGLITTGVVSNYLLIVNTVSSLAYIVFTSLSASIGSLNATDDDNHKYLIFKSLNLINYWIYGWSAIGIAVLSSDVVRFFFGAQYITSFSICIILAINFYMLGMQSVVGIYKTTMGLFRHGQYVLFATAIINVIGDIFLGKAFGVFGIFLATAIARLITNTWFEPYVVYRYGLKKNFGKYLVRYFNYAVLLCITGTICFFICKMIHTEQLPQLLIKTGICIVIPNTLFLLAFHKLPEFKTMTSLLNNYRIKLVSKLLKKTD